MNTNAGDPLHEGAPIPSDPPAPGDPPTRSRLSPKRLGVPLAILLVLVAVLAVRATRPPSLALEPDGAPAPDFTLASLDGETHQLSTYLGSPIVVNFWASWCYSCEDEAPVLAQAEREWRDQGVVFVGVNTKDGKTWAREFVERHGLEYLQLFDGDGSVSRSFGLTGHPETYFIDRKGRIAAKRIGPVDRASIDQYLAEILSRST